MMFAAVICMAMFIPDFFLLGNYRVHAIVDSKRKHTLDVEHTASSSVAVSGCSEKAQDTIVIEENVNGQNPLCNSFFVDSNAKKPAADGKTKCPSDLRVSDLKRCPNKACKDADHAQCCTPLESLLCKTKDGTTATQSPCICIHTPGKDDEQKCTADGNAFCYAPNSGEQKCLSKQVGTCAHEQNWCVCKYGGDKKVKKCGLFECDVDATTAEGACLMIAIDEDENNE